MSFELMEDELYRIYDTAVAKTLETLSDYDAICLSGFDRKNQEHLFVLRVALMMRDLYQTPIEIGTNWWDGVVINWKIRKGFDRVKIVSPCAHGIWVKNLIGKIKSEIKEESGICVHLDNIYRAYYEGSCG